MRFKWLARLGQTLNKLGLCRQRDSDKQEILFRDRWAKRISVGSRVACTRPIHPSYRKPKFHYRNDSCMKQIVGGKKERSWNENKKCNWCKNVASSQTPCMLIETLAWWTKINLARSLFMKESSRYRRRKTRGSRSSESRPKWSKLTTNSNRRSTQNPTRSLKSSKYKNTRPQMSLTDYTTMQQLE